MTDLQDVRRRWATACAEAEQDEPVTGSARAAAVADADNWRVANDHAPLVDEHHPELELHERARTLGLLD